MLIRLTGLTDTPLVASFSTFARDNADLALAGEPAPQVIYARLLRGETVTLGGGAAPLITIEAIAGNDLAEAA